MFFRPPTSSRSIPSCPWFCRVWFPRRSLGDLYNQVGPEGSYLSDGVRLVEKRYVEFTGAAESEAGAETGLLKIRLENSLGESATRLFTEPL